MSARRGVVDENPRSNFGKFKLSSPPKSICCRGGGGGGGGGGGVSGEDSSPWLSSSIVSGNVSYCLPFRDMLLVGSLDGWLDGWMVGWMDGWLGGSLLSLCLYSECRHGQKDLPVGSRVQGIRKP